MLKRVFPKLFLYSLFIYLILFLNLGLYRVVLFLTTSPKFGVLPLSDWLYTIFIGSRFDLASSSILTFLFFFIFASILPFKVNIKKAFKIASIFPLLLLLITITIDLTFYKWLSIRPDSRFFPYVIDPNLWGGAASDVMDGVPVFQLFICYIFYFLLNFFLIKKTISILNYESHGFSLRLLPIHIFLTLFLLALFFVGIRGVESFPLRTNDYIYHKKEHYNTLSRSPIFHIAGEIMVYIKLNQGSRYAALMPKEDILRLREFMGFPKEYKSKNPLEHPMEKCFRSKKYMLKKPVKKPNIIYFVIESLDYKNYMPQKFLNSLAKKSFHSNRFSSVGTSTVDGLWGTLCSILPSLGRQQSALLNNKFQCLPTVLKDLNYKNYFFFGGDINMDQMSLIAKKTDFHTLIGRDKFPPEEKQSFSGILDDAVLLNRVLEEAKKAKEPFFFYLLNSQTHHNHFIPEGWVWPEDQKQRDSYGFLDLHFKKFFEKASKEEFFKNTIFIITADHTYHSMSYNYETDDETIGSTLWQFRIPLIIYAPEYIKPYELKHFTTQADIAPTIYDILDLDFDLMGWGSSMFCGNEDTQRTILLNRRGAHTRCMTIIKGKKMYSVTLPKFNIPLELKYNSEDPYGHPLIRVPNSSPEEIVDLSNFLYYSNRNIEANKFYWN